MTKTPDPPEDDFTEEEIKIIETALTILPHLGPEATADYLDRATGHHQGAHRDD